jgi:integrase
VCDSLDTGLRPIEVERATVEWVDLHNEVLRVPKDASRKDDVEWDSALTSRTVDVLERWLDQRGHMTKYDDTDALWLTRRGNPYGSHALSHLMDNLAVGAGIEHAGRDLTWYSIRRGLGTAIIDEADLSTAQEQLRHLDPKTTMRYDQRPAERRRETLDRLG